MKLSKVKDVFIDWVKSGFYFGKGFSNMIADKIEMKNPRLPTAAFDTAAGAGLSYLAVTSALGTTLGAVVAATMILSAPVSAVLTIAVAPLFLAFSTITLGIGLGLLDSARLKFGIGSTQDATTKARAFGRETSSALRDIIGRGKKATADFKTAVTPKAADVKPADPAAKPAPKPNDFTF